MASGKPREHTLLSLYSPECLRFLQQAVQQAEVEHEKEAVSSKSATVVQGLPTFEYFDPMDRDEEQESDAESSSSSSSSEEEGEKDESEPLAPLPEKASQLPTQPSDRKAAAPTPPPLAPKFKKLNDAKQRQREKDIKRHAHNLNRTSFNIDDNLVIQLPTALLPRQHSKRTQCQAMKDLAEATDPVIVLLLRSGRFAAAVYQKEKCIQHTSSQRYTVRKGQGKAQSAQDGSRRPKSMGSQLRRAGEQSLKEDVQETMKKWKPYFDKASLILVSCPKTMKSTLFDAEVFDKSDPRLFAIPFDIGRPTFEAAGTVHEALLTVLVGEPMSENEDTVESKDAVKEKHQVKPAPEVEENKKEEKKQEEIIPLSDLHIVARDGNLTALLDILRDLPDGLIDQAAGYDFMTPLHFAAESTSNVDPATAAACISALLIQAHADPCQVDARMRYPYFLASHDKTREAFRKARAVLGEEYCDWDAAKVGPALTEDDLNARKEKEAEKKKRKKQKQKEKKEKEKVQAEAMEKRRQEQEEEERKAEEAKRIRDALDPKVVRKDNVCDFCQTEVKGRKRQQMFKRLDYNYCSSECVQKHKRELMAKAAMERFK